MMPSDLDRIREEHDDLLPWLENVRMAADRVGEAPAETIHELVAEIHEFLTQHLIPHALSEDEVLYPAVERMMRAPGATATMTRDHTEVVRLTEELGFLRSHIAGHTPGELQAKSLRRILYGLEAIVRLHFTKEEELYLPVLEEGLEQDEADQLVIGMEESALKARERAVEHAHPGARTLTA